MIYHEFYLVIVFKNYTTMVFLYVACYVFYHKYWEKQPKIYF